MARVVHIALKVDDLEKATKFYEDVFGIYQTKTGHARGHTSRHMTDGNIDLALMVYDSEEEAEAKLSGAGPCIHHLGHRGRGPRSHDEEDRRERRLDLLRSGGGRAQVPRARRRACRRSSAIGRYKKKDKSKVSRIVHLALKVDDLEKATKFYENVFGFKQLNTERYAKHVSRHMTDGDMDIALMAWTDGNSEEAPAGRPRHAHPSLGRRGRRSRCVRRSRQAARRRDPVEAGRAGPAPAHARQHDHGSGLARPLRESPRRVVTRKQRRR